jgi:hypothetical protein
MFRKKHPKYQIYINSSKKFSTSNTNPYQLVFVINARMLKNKHYTKTLIFFSQPGVNFGKQQAKNPVHYMFAYKENVQIHTHTRTGRDG